MTLKVAINGFGRIGRCVARILIEKYKDQIELVAINGPASIDSHIHLLKYDSIHGRFASKVERKGDDLVIDGHHVMMHKERDPSNLPWDKYGIDVVFECSGVFKDQESAGKHITSGAKKVLISAPAKDDSKTIVYGVNEDELQDSDDIISIGSCTTNCLAPIVKIINDNIGIEKGFVTTVHAYTNDQNIADGSHSDLRRARAAALSMIPTSTGAAKAISKVIPEVEGKLDGTAIRVPTPNVSMIDLCFLSKKSIAVDELNLLMKEKRKGSMLQVLDYVSEPLVSIDFNHSEYSSVFDATGTKIIGDDFIRLVGWYDNEWGFSNRMVDIALLMNK